MAFIGNTVQNQGFTPAIDYFNGNGVTVTFTLSRPIASVAQVIVAVDNVIQNPSSAFNVVGNSITFTSAPLSGTNNIWVEYTSLITTYQGISQDPTVIGDIRATGGYLAEGDFGNSFIDGNLIDYVTGRGRFTVGELDDITFYHGGTSGRSAMMDLYYAGGAKVYGTTALTIPVGTTGQRPGTPAVGMIRYNTDEADYEVYTSTGWSYITPTAYPYTIEYLTVAGGGGGGSSDGAAYYGGGGGGAGGAVDSTVLVTPTTAYSIVIGAGGSGGSGGARGSTGQNTTAFGSTFLGGGGGGGYANSSGGSGGSGGGARPDGSGGAGTSGQGNNGGTGNNGGGCGGGGKGAAGSPNSGYSGGAGGAGINWKSLGTFYAGGGGGGLYDVGSAGAGGAGGGGAGNVAGTTNTGGGGGGGNSGNTGKNGGSGIAIIRYAGSQRGTGGTVTSVGGYTYHTFTSSGTYTA